MTNHPTRADWWREVTDPNGVIPKGCPVRTEYGGHAMEYRTTCGWTLAEFSENARLFVDSRWKPPVPTTTYVVGDIIHRPEDLEAVPYGTLILGVNTQRFWQASSHYLSGTTRQWVTTESKNRYVTQELLTLDYTFEIIRLPEENI